MSEWLKKPPYALERVKSEQKRRSNLLASGENLRAWSKERGLTLTEGKELLRENYKRSPKIGTLNRLIKRKLVQSDKNKVKWKNVGDRRSTLLTSNSGRGSSKQIEYFTNLAIPKVLE